MLDSESSLEIISVHVPKTAGTTFGNILQEVYGSDRVFLDYAWNAPCDHLGVHVKAIHGHFPASKYKALPSHIKRIAWIRNPIDRLISHYFYWQHIPISKRAGSLHRYVIENNIGLLDFAKIPEINNHISSLYIDIDINEFYFIGIQEHFEEDFKQLSSMLKFPNIELNHENSNPLPDYQLFKNSSSYQTTIDQLTDINFKDMQLYKAALELRTHRISELRSLD